MKIKKIIFRGITVSYTPVYTLSEVNLVNECELQCLELIYHEPTLYNCILVVIVRNSKTTFNSVKITA